MREFLEKNYKDTSGKETIKLTIRALLEVCVSDAIAFSYYVFAQHNDTLLNLLQRLCQIDN
jgi:20S proteasome subunit alpha 4